MLPNTDLRLARSLMEDRLRRAQLDALGRRLKDAGRNGTAAAREIASLPDFVLPDVAHAPAPPEAGGRGREQVRLLHVRRAEGRFEHRQFEELPQLLCRGDLLVFNASQTMPASVPVRRLADGRAVRAHFSTRLNGYLPNPPAEAGPSPAPRPAPEHWVVEMRVADGTAPLDGELRPGERFEAPDGTEIQVTRRYRGFDGMWEALVSGNATGLMYRYGDAVRYGYVQNRWPLATYETPVGEVAGSAEMPSAARPFTGRIVWELRRRGVEIAKILLHTGLSSHELSPGRPGAAAVYPEWYELPASTADQVNRALRERRRVVAVGTTVVRALESAARVAWGRVRVQPSRAWTDLFIGPGYRPRVVGALVTGLHAPRTTHLAMMAALVSPRLLHAAYLDALEKGYRWHEFGDLCLIG